MSNTGWSDDRVATLRKLWFDGLTASQIARRLGGVTRNAVIGKVHRLGLGGRGASPASSRTRPALRPRRQPMRSAPAVRMARPAPAPSIAPRPEGPGIAADLVQLAAHACKWPIGDPKRADFSFCGRPADGRYCTVHTQVSVRPDPGWRPERDPVVRRALAGLV